MFNHSLPPCRPFCLELLGLNGPLCPPHHWPADRPGVPPESSVPLPSASTYTSYGSALYLRTAMPPLDVGGQKLPRRSLALDEASASALPSTLPRPSSNAERSPGLPADLLASPRTAGKRIVTSTPWASAGAVGLAKVGKCIATNPRVTTSPAPASQPRLGDTRTSDRGGTEGPTTAPRVVRGSRGTNSEHILQASDRQTSRSPTHAPAHAPEPEPAPARRNRPAPGGPRQAVAPARASANLGLSAVCPPPLPPHSARSECSRHAHALAPDTPHARCISSDVL